MSTNPAGSVSIAMKGEMNMSKKRFFVAPAVLCAGMVMLQAPGVAQAEEVQAEALYQEGAIATEAAEQSVNYMQIIRNTYLSEAKAVTVEDVIYTGLLNAAEKIDISSYGITGSELSAIYHSLINDNADLFYVSGSLSWFVDGKDMVTVTSVVPSYKMSGDELTAAKETFNEKIEEITAPVDDSWSDMEIALYFHDYLATHFEYDMRVYDSVLYTDVVYDAYGFLTQGTGVCQAYTLTYNYLLKLYGINGNFATSEAMNHIWNIIEIDGQWYHVDVTWDDPVYDNLGRSRHVNFLRSDDGIMETGHYGWVTDVETTAETYDTAFWQSSDAPFVFVDDQWYFVDDNGVQTCDINSQTAGDVIFSNFGRWYSGASSFWIGVFSGLGEYNGIIYFNSASKIYAYDTETKETSVAYELSLSGTTSIYGLLVDENIIYYGTGASPNEQIVKSGSYELPLAPTINMDADVEFTYELDDTETELICKGEAITTDSLKEIFGDSAVVYNGTTALEAGAAVGTGYEVKVGKDTYTVVVKGDSNGDARINVEDMESIQKHILQISELEGVYKEAGLLRDSAVSLSVEDMEIIQKYILMLIEW